MARVVTEPCNGCKDRGCVEVCPVDCFYEDDDQLYVHPDECIDCAACEPSCPVQAIFPEATVPRKWQPYIRLNAALREAPLPRAAKKWSIAAALIAMQAKEDEAATL